MPETASTNSDVPIIVSTLQKHFGQASQAGFGSSVFYKSKAPSVCDLDDEARSCYQYFLGPTWEKLGEQNWLSNWGMVYERKSDAQADIVSELKSIADREVRMSAGLLLENQEDATAAVSALKGAFDHTAVRQLKIFKIGDGAAMSGLLIAANMHEMGCLCLILLLD